jgi:hypothetical protein
MWNKTINILRSVKNSCGMCPKCFSERFGYVTFEPSVTLSAGLWDSCTTLLTLVFPVRFSTACIGFLHLLNSFAFICWIHSFDSLLGTMAVKDDRLVTALIAYLSWTDTKVTYLTFYEQIYSLASYLSFITTQASFPPTHSTTCLDAPIQNFTNPTVSQSSQ